MPALRSQLLAVHRASYRAILGQICSSVVPGPAVRRYARAYNRRVASFDAVSNPRELIRRILSSSVVYHGDYHTLWQSQQAVLKILREIALKRKVILCLEMFHSEDQKAVDRFVKDQSAEHAFLRSIRFARKWGYSWNNWKPIVDFCKGAAIPVMGINSGVVEGDETIRERDKCAARIIGKTILANPDALVYVVIGDYHIAPENLPADVERLLGPFDVAPKRTLIYQNAEKLYWRLAARGQEEADVLRLCADSFCIMNTTPANKLQSYLNWLECSRDAYYPTPQGWLEPGESAENASVPALARTICDLLGLPSPEPALQRLEIHYGSNCDFMSAAAGRSEQLRRLMPAIRRKVSRNEGFLLEFAAYDGDSYIVYLPNSSLNMAAEEAAHFVNASLRGRLEKSIRPFDLFYRTVMTESLGFFGSKLINEKRRAPTPHSLRQFLGSCKNRRCSREELGMIMVCRLILRHRCLEGRGASAALFAEKFKTSHRMRSTSADSFATQLGYMLGERLYNAVKKGRAPLQDVRALFAAPLEGEGEAFEAYMTLSARLKPKN